MSSTNPPRYTLTDFAASVQLDPLAKKIPLVSGQAVDKAYAAPEIAASETGRYNPILGDRYSLGKTLERLAQVSVTATSEWEENERLADAMFPGFDRMRRWSRRGWPRWLRG